MGLYYMLSKVFVAANTRGSFDSGMAAIVEKSSDKEVGMYLIHLFSGEDLVALQSCWTESHFHTSCLS